jgi:GH35 family endo-1,4-beta-xylanase
MDFTWFPKFQGNEEEEEEEEEEDLVCDVAYAVVHRYCECVIKWDVYNSCVINPWRLTNADRLKRLVWNDCKLCKSAIV